MARKSKPTFDNEKVLGDFTRRQIAAIYAYASQHPCDCGEEYDVRGCLEDCASQREDDYVDADQVRHVLAQALRLKFIKVVEDDWKPQ